jgi:transposase
LANHSLPRSDFGRAVRYMLERWAGLTRFLDDAGVPLDNNAAERALRGPCGPEESLRLAVTPRHAGRGLFYTLCETAKLAGVDPRAYVLRALYTAIERPCAITFAEDLLMSTAISYSTLQPHFHFR